MIDAAMSNGPLISDQHNDVHAPTIKSATVPSSIRENGSNAASQPEVVEPVEASDFSRPLSPYPSVLYGLIMMVFPLLVQFSILTDMEVSF